MLEAVAFNLLVRAPASHAGDRGSNPARTEWDRNTWMAYYSGVILKCAYDGHITIPWGQVDAGRSRDNDIVVSIVCLHLTQTLQKLLLSSKC